MNIGIEIKEKYPEYEAILSLLPKGALSAHLTPLDEIRIEYPSVIIYVSDDIFTDSEVLSKYLVKSLLKSQSLISEKAIV